MSLTLPPHVTDRAFDRLAEIAALTGKAKALRVAVEGGGCSGFQYGFTFEESINEDDTQVTKDSVTLLIDPMSLQYLMGAEIDYQDSVQGSQFVIKNPNAQTTCGCGSSFSA